MEDSFAKSVLWGFTVAAESNGRVLVDATDFFLRDMHGAGNALRPGNYRVDRDAQRVLHAEHQDVPEEHRGRRDADLRRTKQAAAGAAAAAAGAGPGGDRRSLKRRASADVGGGLFSGTVASVTPTAEAVTLREHYSLVELPDGNFKPRNDDPRAGYGGLQLRRLQRADRRADGDPLHPPPSPGEERPERGDQRAGEADPVLGGLGRARGREEGADRRRELVEPGVRGRRFPQRLQGRRPARRRRPDGHPLQHDQLGPPLDARLELGRLGHRSAHRRDHQGDGHARLAARSAGLHDLRRPALAVRDRRREARRSSTRRRSSASASSSAHEVGHTLGLGHNYYDSTKGWISVMDYPHPLEKLNADGTIDLSEAYPRRASATGTRSPSITATAQFPKGTTRRRALTKILDDAWAQDLRYFTNQDTDIHPRADQWSNGVNQADELNRLMKVRRAALEPASASTRSAPARRWRRSRSRWCRSSCITATRWNAPRRWWRARTYIYAMRGDGRTPTKWESAANQRKALDALAATLKPSELTVPEAGARADSAASAGLRHPPRALPAHDGRRLRSAQPRRRSPPDVTIGFVLQPDRAARMVAQHAVDPTLPGLEEVIDRLTKATFDAPTATPYEAEVRRAEERVLVDRVIVARDRRRRTARCARSRRSSCSSGARLKANGGKDEAEQAQRTLLAADIKRFLERPAEVRRCCPPPERRRRADRRRGQDWLARPPGCAWDDADRAVALLSAAVLDWQTGTALRRPHSFQPVMLVPNWHHHDYPPSTLPHRLF